MRFGVVLAILSLVLGVMMAAITKNPVETFVRDPKNKCETISRTPSEERIYCGKACWQPAQVVKYFCGDGKYHEVLESL